MPAQTKYNPAYHDDWAWSLAMKGATDAEIAEAFGISNRTIIRWKSDYLSFAQSLSTGKNVADAKVEKKLYERALGYEIEEVERIVEVDADGNTKPVRVRTNKKHIAPEVMAQMYWLNNRKRSTGEWSQRQDVNLSGSINTGPDLSGLSDDDLKTIIRAVSDESK